jgi:hypothetical protein
MSIFAQVEKAIEREFRRWTEKAFGPADASDLTILHRAILEEVQGRIQTVQRGKKVFPYSAVTIRLIAAEAARREMLAGAFEGEERRLEQDIRQCLTGAGCTLPAGFTVEVETAEAGSGNYEIRYGTAKPVAAPAARLVVVRGRANQETFALDGERVNLGRKAELTDSLERVIRRNDVIFEEGADEANATVSRGHAHIRREQGAEAYRLCDDSSEYGTRIFRSGRSIEVPPGVRGERLRPGDEIYLGRACLRFELGTGSKSSAAE